MAGIKIRPIDIANEIVMSVENFFILIEGENDYRFFKNRPFPRRVIPIICYGWENIVEIAKHIFEKGAHKKAAPVIDRDYNGLRCKDIEYELCKIIQTDYHSIESIMFFSSAFGKVMAEFASEDKIKKNFGSIDQLKVKIAQKCSCLGKYRAYCSMKAINVKFKDAKHGKLCSKNDLSVTHVDFLDHLRGFPGNEALVKQDEWDAAQKSVYPSPYSDLEYICHGHDLMNFLAIAMKKQCGSMPGNLHGDTVESYFRLSYCNEELLETAMWKKIIERMS